MLNSFFRGLLGSEELPTRVLEVRSDSYVSRPIRYREDSLLLYGPKAPNDGKNVKDKCYEIVLQKPFTESLHQMYRCRDPKAPLPLFLKCRKRRLTGQSRYIHMNPSSPLKNGYLFEDLPPDSKKRYT